MDLDSRVVNKEIRSKIWPSLKKAGFTAFSARTAWRYQDDRIHVLNFQSFNDYLASGLGCTSFSFAINLGVFLRKIPGQFGPGRIKKKDGLLRPAEHECHFRRPLHESLRQPEFPRKNIWYIDKAGSNLNPVMDDAWKTIARDAFEWFDRFNGDAEVLRTLLKDKEDMDRTFGMGKNPSPIRHYLTGYVAMGMGKADLAAEHLQKAAGSGCFKMVEGNIQQSIKEIQKNGK